MILDFDHKFSISEYARSVNNSSPSMWCSIHDFHNQFTIFISKSKVKKTFLSHDVCRRRFLLIARVSIRSSIGDTSLFLNPSPIHEVDTYLMMKGTLILGNKSLNVMI